VVKCMSKDHARRVHVQNCIFYGSDSFVHLVAESYWANKKNFYQDRSLLQHTLVLLIFPTFFGFFCLCVGRHL